MVAPGADDLEDDFDFHPSWSEHEADNENENEKNSPSIAQESLPTKAKKRKRNREKLKANKVRTNYPKFPDTILTNLFLLEAENVGCVAIWPRGSRKICID